MAKNSKPKTQVEQAEILDKMVRMDGVGEDPAVRAMLSEGFVQGSNVEASEIAIALREIIRGQGLLGDQVLRITERMDKMDKDVIERDKKQQKYIQEVLDRAESLKASGAEKDKIEARGLAMFQKAMENAKAQMTYNNLKFEQELKDMPKEMVVSPGELVTVIENGQQVARLTPEIIRIRNKTWILQPGELTEVPKVVGDRLRNRRRGEAETAARKEILSQNLEGKELQKKWQEINSRFGVQTETMPTA